MRKSKRNFGSLLAGLAGAGAIIYIVLNFSPDKSLKVLNFFIPTTPIFFVLFFVTIYELFTFLLNNQRRGFLISFFATLYLILRLNRLAHPFFLILVILLFITFELLLRKRK